MMYDLICGQPACPSERACGEGDWEQANGNPTGALGHTEAKSWHAGGPMAPAQVGTGLTGGLCSLPSQVAASGGGHFKEVPFKAGLRLKFPKGPVRANEIIKSLLVKWV